MESEIWLKNGHSSSLTLTEEYISWDTPHRKLIFPWQDVIGSQIGISPEYSTLMVFHRLKDKFKIYRLQFSEKSESIRSVNVINTHSRLELRKSYAIFVNPISGHKRSKEVYKSMMVDILNYSGLDYELFKISSPEYFVSFNTNELLRFSEIICVGGDGTMQELLTVIEKNQMVQKFNFGIIPTGSQNALACELTGLSLNSALVAMVKGKTCLGDLMKVTVDGKELVATTAVSWGLISDISQQAAKLRILGPFRYDFTGFFRFFQPWNSYNANISVDGEESYLETSFVTIGNHSTKSLNGGEIVFPKGNIEDGLLDLQILQFVGRCKTLKILNNMRKGGQHLKSKKILYRKVRTVTISPKNLTAFNIDGEIHNASEVQIEVMHKYISYIII